MFEKEVYIRLSDDGAGFEFTVTYGSVSLPAREVRVFAAGQAMDWPDAPIEGRQSESQDQEE